ncbi:unnamed protein product [Calypogeia fissa]
MTICASVGVRHAISALPMRGAALSTNWTGGFSFEREVGKKATTCVRMSIYSTYYYYCMYLAGVRRRAREWRDRDR